MIESFQITLDNQETRQLIYRFNESGFPDGWYTQHDNIQYRIESETFDERVIAVDDPDRLRSLPHRLEVMDDVGRFSVPRVNELGIVVPSTSSRKVMPKFLPGNLTREIEMMFLPDTDEGGAA